MGNHALEKIPSVGVVFSKIFFYVEGLIDACPACDKEFFPGSSDAECFYQFGISSGKIQSNRGNPSSDLFKDYVLDVPCLYIAVLAVVLGAL